MARREPTPPEGEPDPLDAALRDVQDIGELEQRFAMLDAQLDEETDPFSDIARALREHRAASDAAQHSDADEDSTLLAEDEDSLLEGHHDESGEDEDPVAAEIEERCQDALDALEIDDIALARELAMAAVKLDDEHPFPMFVLGLVAEQDGDLDMARDMAELSLRTAGTNADAIGLRAHIHVRQHEFAEAEELLRFGIAHNPDDATLHEGLARVALARGDHESALQSASAALRIEPDNPGALAVRAAALDASSDRGAMLAALRQGVQLHPEDPYAMVELASVEMEHGNLERARVLLMRAQRLAPRDAEIGDVRALVEHVHERPLLRPVPGLLRWMRDFPGGFAGFLIGFAIAALPLHALATMAPEYRLAVILIMSTWGLVALYAWVAPSVLTHRLNQRAARNGEARILQELEDPLATPPPLERLSDVMAMLATANERRRAAALVATVADRAAEHEVQIDEDGVASTSTVVAPLRVLGRRLRGPRARLRSLIRIVPGAPRMLVAAAAGCIVVAPALESTAALPNLLWLALGGTSLLAAWTIVLVERAMVRDVDDTFTAIRLAATTARSADPRR